MDPKLQYIKDLTISEGSLNAIIGHPGEVMILAIREPSASFALIHNHPSGDLTPSQQNFFGITH
ncbi:MAG: JAB domain-containing protein [Nitrospinaceae bacterium]